MFTLKNRKAWLVNMYVYNNNNNNNNYYYCLSQSKIPFPEFFRHSAMLQRCGIPGHLVGPTRCQV